jgi:two-component sensor histidine kinase
MAQWSLRTNLVAVVAVSFVPVLGLSGLWAYQDAAANRTRRTEVIVAAAEIAASGHRQILEGSRRLLVSACSEDAVQKSADPAASPADVDRCETYLARLLQKFPTEYSAAVVTDAGGEVRCASAPSAIDKNLGDREIFRAVRDKKDFSIGTTIASRVTRSAIVPLAVPIVRDGQFAGMCAIGISLKAFSDDATFAAPVDAILVDRGGAPLGGKSQSAFALPSAGRIAEAITSRRLVFTDFGQNGLQYEFHVLPVAGDALFTVAAVPVGRSLPEELNDWGLFALIVASLVTGLLAIWIGAERWVVRPLSFVQEFAGRVARGENIKLEPPQPWTPEMIAVSKGINEMAEAIASREGELRSGLEQRDHMLREIHHRVKNNLQMISSLLNLQAGEIRSPRLRRFFGDAQNRVLTLSILHRHLYERSSWSLVDFQQFISDLVRQITVARPGDRPPPRYQIRAPVMAVGPDVAIPVGLIVTEAVSSALSHDFGAVASPEIRIEAIQKADDRAELVIEDNGVDTGNGSIEPTFRGGFGVTLLRGLSMQLGGEATISAREGGGVRIVVAFPLTMEQEGDD